MAIWIGEAGGLRIGRPESQRVYSYIDAADVNTGAKRFSFRDQRSTLVTGDLVWIRRVNDIGTPTADLLDFVSASGWADNTQQSDGKWYVNTDTVGGIRLFDTWQKAVNNNLSDAISLEIPSGSYRVSYETVADSDDFLAQLIGWTLNTDREVADFTSLGDSFKQQMGTLVSGSGDLNCYFDTTWRGGAPDFTGREESPIFMHRLALRQEVGAKFKGVFLLKRTDSVPIGTLISKTESDRELFYAADCVITSVGTELIADQPIQSKITFVTTGPIQLIFDFPESYLLQEQPPNDLVLQESGFGILLEVPA